VAGRLQGDPGSARRPPLRLRIVVAAVVVAALVASAAIGAAEVLPRVQDGIDRDSKLTSVQRRHAAGDRLGLDSAPFDAFKEGLQARDRYSVDVPAGSKGPFITRGEVVRAYAAFFFLPAIQVPAAERVFHYRFR
jgi:hypothetical protein